MKRLFLIGVIALAMGVVAAGLMSWQASRPNANATPEAKLARAEVEAEITPDGLVPYRIQVPKNHEVHLLVRVAPRAKEGSLALLGYEDVTPPVYLGPGEGREIVFASTRPGDDFAVALDGKVIGRLEVTGGHLEEGHQ